MENQKSYKGIITLLIVIIIMLSGLCVLFATGIISFKSINVDANKSNNNITDNNNGENALSMICATENYDKLEILSMENKTESIGSIGGSMVGYNAITTVTKEHNYTSTPAVEELYASDMLGTLYVLYKNKLYYSGQNDIISKYCKTYSSKLICDYSKFDDNTIKEFNSININLNLKAIGSYGNSGSGSSYPYAITNDGKVINLPDVVSHNYSNCGIMYDNLEYPIDRIFNINLYNVIEYTILLKDGTLITRNVDYENPIELEH